MLPHILAMLLLISPCQSDPPPPPDRATSQPGEPGNPGTKTASQQDKQAGSKGKGRRPMPRNLAVRAMEMVIEEAEFKDVTFEDFAEWLERTTKANVVVRWKVLEKAGVERDRPITIKEKNIKLRKLLSLVFVQATEDLRDVELAAKADGNTLMISTKTDINARLITRVYDVQDLLVSVPDFTASTFGEIRTGRRVGDRFLEATGGEKPRSPSEPADELIKVITAHIQPLSWKLNGGKGTIRHYKGRLIIRNNIEVHQELAGYLSGEDEPERNIERPALRR